MSLCQECGSEISNSDVFCPFCGISIVRSAPPEPVADESMESTIVITPAQAADLKQAAAVDASTNTADAPQDAESAPPVFSRTAPTLEDIPTPMVLSTGFARPTDPNVSVDSSSHKVDEISEPLRIDTDLNADEARLAGDEERRPELVEISKGVALEHVEDQRETTGIPEPVSPRESAEVLGSEPKTDAGSDIANSAGSEETIDEVPTEPPVPAINSSADVEQEIKVDRSAIEEDQRIDAVPELKESGPQESVSETPIAISKPLEQLEETRVTPSMFDSVRIMEGGITPSSSNADNIDTIIPGREMFVGINHKSAEPEPTESEATPSPVVVTEHGIGTSDTDGRRSAKLKPLPEGTLLNGRYEIVRKIGGGGMGAVYLASDNNLGGVLRAVKEMVQAHIEEDQQEKAINDFKRESMILSTLDHPSIPTIYDYFYDGDEGRFYLVMKYISGGDLSSKLRAAPEGKIEELTVTEWAIQITDVLNYLHNQPSTIVYRDLKPSNVMLDGNSSRVMLIDFGIARNINQKEEKGVTAVGTMGYAPPELFSGNVEPRSDIYSLGSTMFHLLTGADPQSNPLLIFDFQKNPRPRQINPRLSDQMERILMRSVEYDAEARFGSAAEMKAVLEEHLAKLRTGSVTYGVGEAPVSVSLANQSVFCGFCGQRIVATDLFCAFCGAKQPIAQQGVHSEIYQKAMPTARLVIEGTSELSAPIYALQKDENLIGRRDPMSNIFPEVDLSKFDPQTKISRRHAKIWRDGTSFMLEDLGSSNGTIIEGAASNGLRLAAHQPFRLSSGDRIKIGDTRLHFVIG